MFPRSLGQISRPCSTSILRFVFCTTASDLPVCFQTIAVHCWQSDNFKLSALLVDLRSVNHHLFVNLATIELVRADLHIWTQLQICHLSSSLMLWTSILFNTLQYFEHSSKFVIHPPLQYFELQYFPILNTLQMKDFCNCCRSKTWKSWPNNSLKKVSERVRQDGGVLSKLKNWMEKWKWFSGGTSAGGNNSKKLLQICCSHIIPRLRLFRRCYSLVDHSSQKQETVSMIQPAKF